MQGNFAWSSCLFRKSDERYRCHPFLPSTAREEKAPLAHVACYARTLQRSDAIAEER